MEVADLEALISQLWGLPPANGSVEAPDSLQIHPHLRRATQANAPQKRVVETYAIVPSRARASFLIPLDSRPVAAASLSHYNELRSGRVRLARKIISAAMSAGLGKLVFRDRLCIEVGREVSDDELDDLLLIRNIARALGYDRLSAGIGVRPPDPNRKPTLQLFEPDTGKPAGYAKVGWNIATRRLVDNEALALQRLEGTTHQQFSQPRLLAHFSWRDRSVAVTDPLPPGVQALPARLLPLMKPIPDIAGKISWEPLATSSYWARLTGLADEYSASEPVAGRGEILQRFLSLVGQQAAGLDLPYGSWHGDWVPWNIATDADRLWVWDWEHFAEDVPLGFDAIHWIFQVSLILHGERVSSCCRTALLQGVPVLAQLDIPEPAARVIAHLYLAEMFLRTFVLHRDGSGWNTALYPGLLDVMSDLCAGG